MEVQEVTKDFVIIDGEKIYKPQLMFWRGVG